MNKESRALWFLVGALAIITLEIGGAAIAVGGYDPPPAPPFDGKVPKEINIYIDEGRPGPKPVVKYSGCKEEKLVYKRKQPDKMATR